MCFVWKSTKEVWKEGRNKSRRKGIREAGGIRRRRRRRRDDEGGDDLPLKSSLTFSTEVYMTGSLWLCAYIEVLLDFTDISARTFS